MRDQHQIASSLLRNALCRGLSRDAAVRIVKSVLGDLDKPTYSANEEQTLLDRTRDACVLAKLDALAGTVRRDTLEAVRVRPGGATASANARLAATPGKGTTPMAKNSTRRPAPTASVTKGGGRREFLISSAGVRRIDTVTASGRLNLFK